MPEASGSAAARLRLLAWLSPAFPVGAFSYSSGLEGAAHEGLATNAEDLRSWIATLIEQGTGWNDAVLFCEAWRRARDGGDLAELAQLGEALAGSQQRHRETMLQGEAFLAAARGWPGLAVPELGEVPPYCVAVGAICGANDISQEDACAAFLQAFASNLIQAGIRLSVLGQTQAVGVLAALEPVVLAAAKNATASTLDDLGSATIIAEIVSMRHEIQHSRLFRS